MTDKTLICPRCGSDEVTLAHIQTFMANTGDHFCHSTKVQDPDSPARCLGCDWTGVREELQEDSE